MTSAKLKLNIKSLFWTKKKGDLLRRNFLAESVCFNFVSYLEIRITSYVRTACYFEWIKTWSLATSAFCNDYFKEKTGQNIYGYLMFYKLTDVKSVKISARPLSPP